MGRPVSLRLSLLPVISLPCLQIKYIKSFYLYITKSATVNTDIC
jgi:hypothetical protein